MGSKITFKYPLGVGAKDKVTGFAGIISGRLQMINGAIQYALQPSCKKGTNYVGEGMNIDEKSIVLNNEQKATKPDEVTFAFQTGDCVKNRINGFSGIITHRIQYLNGCIAYIVEAAMKEDKEIRNKAWEQELVFVTAGLNAKEEAPIARKRTGGPSTRVTLIGKAF